MMILAETVWITKHNSRNCTVYLFLPASRLQCLCVQACDDRTDRYMHVCVVPSPLCTAMTGLWCCVKPRRGELSWGDGLSISVFLTVGEIPVWKREKSRERWRRGRRAHAWLIRNTANSAPLFYTRTNFSESKGKLSQLINEHCMVTLDASVRSQQMLLVTTTDHKVVQCNESFDSAAVQCRKCTLSLRPDQRDYGQMCLLCSWWSAPVI